MVYTCKPKKVSIYVNTGRKTTSQIKAETGCTALINGGLYEMSTFKPVYHLKVDGKVLVIGLESYEQTKALYDELEARSIREQQKLDRDTQVSEPIDFENNQTESNNDE